MDTPKFATPNNNAPETKLHFLDYWRIIRIRKTVILAVFLLVVLTTTAVTFILPESYSSIVRIEVGKDNPDIAPLLMGMQTAESFDPYFIQTEFEKIKSKKVLYQVIDELGLIKRWSERYHTEAPLKTNEAYQLLIRNIDVRQSRNTSLIEIRVYSPKADEAAEIADKIAIVYREMRKSRRREASNDSLEILKKELAAQKLEIINAQTNVDHLRKTLGVSDIDAGQVIMTLEPEVVRQIERERISVQGYSVQLETTLNQLTNKPPKELRETLPTVNPDTILSGLLEKLNTAYDEWSSISAEAGPENPRVQMAMRLTKKLEEQIEARVKGIIAGLETQAASSNARAVALSNQVELAKRKDSENMEKYRPYFQAKRDLESQQRIYDTIRLRILQEAVDANLPKHSIVQVIDQAEINRRPVRPNVPLNIALGVVVGLIMGFGLAFFIEYLDTSVKTIDDVERSLQAPVLGVIPQNVGSLLEEGAESPHAEAYRVLRTNILFSRKDPMWNSLTVVSGGAGEGKSTTIFNLATVFAQQGQRVLMVDSDLRRPSLHKLLNVSNSIGLTNFLLKQNTLEEVIQTTAMPTLNFLPSGKLPSSSLGILNSTQMKDFISQVKQLYDFVFFDSPPIMGVSDASVLASEVDMSLLVIQYRKYPQAMTLRAKQMVEKVGGHLLGVVLNNINISQDSYYYYYSGYYYDYYSKHDEASPKKNGEGKSAVGDRLEIKPKY